MSLSPAFLDELRARTTLSAVIAPSVKLIKAGREFKACCPFHNEKTPSFYVNDEKGFYHCFGCGAHGDAIRFLTDQRGMPFMDAVKELATKAGMEVPAPDPRQRERQERAAGLHDVMAAAQRWFVEQLDGVDGAQARAYLKERGITDATRKKFGFGFAPDSRGKLKAALASVGNDKLVEAGLLIQPDDNKEPYDRFRGRLTYPIRDVRGRVIAFSARILGAGEPKYLNSPDTPLFDKGRTLFNIDLAGPASRTAKRILIVEGQMDVIALDQAGIGEAVAPLGTALTEDQIQRLWRLEPAPICCFDGDSAGQKAALRAALRALPLLTPDCTLRFCSLPSGQDPDDVIASGGVALFSKLIEASLPLHEYIWRAELSRTDPSRPEERARLKSRLDGLANSIQNQDVKYQYTQEFRSRFFDAFGFKKRQIDALRSAISETRSLVSGDGLAIIHRAVLLGLSRFPDVAADHASLVAELPIRLPKLNMWRSVILDAVFENPHLDEDGLETILASSDASPIEKRDLQRDLAFSFFRRMADKKVARRDLEHVMTILVSEAKIDAALNDANRRYQESLESAAWDEQNALRVEKQKLLDEIIELEAALAA